MILSLELSFWRTRQVFRSLPLYANLLSFLVVTLVNSSSHGVKGQEKKQLPPYLAHSHAHNDYEHPQPLIDSLALGFASIETDVWLVDGKLCVAHDRSDVDPNRRLENMYLDPLLDRFNQNAKKLFSNGETLVLLIDFKSEGATTYEALKKLLEKYRPMLLASAEMPTPSLKIIISGNRPVDIIAKDKSRLVFMDGRLKDLQNKIDPSLMPWISDNWRLHFRYMGSGTISAEERQKLRDYVSRVHASGAQLRFWATPENEALWKVLREESVDFIGTDQLERLSNFLK